MDYALLVGIDAYAPPNTLYGCLNDVTDVRLKLIDGYAFAPSSIQLLTDSAATTAGIKRGLLDTVSELAPRDRFVFWYSGHGDQLVLGDAATDVICPIDYAGTAATSITVADFHTYFSQIPNGVRAYWGSDSCHSGDLERAMHRTGIPRLFQRPRHALPQTLRFVTMRDIATTLPNIALLAGCRSNQTCADSFINEHHNGAFTYYFLNVLDRVGGGQTPLRGLIREVQTALTAAHFDQTPELTGSPEAAANPFLGD